MLLVYRMFSFEAPAVNLDLVAFCEQIYEHVSLSLFPLQIPVSLHEKASNRLQYTCSD